MRERGNRIFRFLDSWLGIPLVFPFGLYRRLAPQHSGNGLAILALGAIGDTLLLSGLVNGIRSQAPQLQIDLVTTAANAPAAALLPNLNCFFSFPLRRPDLLLMHFRQKRYKYVMDASQWARLGALLCAASAAEKTIGFQTQGQCRAFPYDVKVHHASSRHETENFLALGKSLWPDLEYLPYLNLPPWKNEADAPVYCHMWPAMGRGRHLKEWPQTYWAQLIGYLLANGKKVILTGGKDDMNPNEAFLNRYFPHNPGIHSVAGRLDLTALGHLFARCGAVVSVNTGIMHLAALTGVPTIGLHGPTNPARWGPVGKRALSLIPAKGDYGYLNLGFEYPENARPVMQHLLPGSVISALHQLEVMEAR